MAEELTLQYDKKETDQQIDKSKITFDTETSKQKFESRFNKIKDEKKLSDLCADLSDPNKKGAALTNLNNILNESFQLTKISHDGKDYVGLSLDKSKISSVTDEEQNEGMIFLEASTFQTEFIKLLNDLFKTCSPEADKGTEFSLSLNADKADETNLMNEIIEGKKGAEIVASKTPDNSTPATPESKTEKKGFWEGVKSFFSEGRNSIKLWALKNRKSKGRIGSIAAATYSFIGGDTGKALQDTGIQIADIANQIFGNGTKKTQEQLQKEQQELALLEAEAAKETATTPTPTPSTGASTPETEEA